MTHYKDKTGKDIFELIDKWLIKTKATANEHSFQSGLDSYNLLTSTMKDHIKTVDYTAFENFAFGGQGLTQLSSTAAVYQLYYAQHAKPVVNIAPTRVKLIIAGKGKAEKEEVRAGLSNFIKDFENIQFKSYDESDAVAIAVASAIVNLYPEKFPAKIKKPRTKIVRGT